MTRFNYQIDPSITIGENKRNEIMKLLDREVDFKELTIFQKIIFSKGFLVFAIITSILMIGMLLIYARRVTWRKKSIETTRNVLPYKIYKIVFESAYNNVKVTQQELIDIGIILKNRGPKIPGDAHIVDQNSGPVFTIDQVRLQTTWIRWMWTRSNGKSTQNYYYNKIYLLSTQIQPQFKNFKLKFKRSHLFSKRGRDLENNDFNKQFWYDYNDGVKARMFFPLTSQERWVEVNQNRQLPYNRLHGFEINVRDGYYLFGKGEVYKSNYGFLYCKKPVTNKQKFVDGLYKNFQNDTHEISSFLRLAIINKYFFK